jgi:NAD(P)-dependent dehydrogenase (short-subunit alcohol dehydrogenase family)
MRDCRKSDEEGTQTHETNGTTPYSLLVNNAGTATRGNNLGSPSLASDALNIINTNAIGPLRVTNALLPLLRKAASEGSNQVKIVNISSRMGSIGDGSSGGAYGYRASKSAENMISVTLAADLAKDNIWSLAVHPGHVATKMGGAHAEIDADSAASQIAKVADNAKKEDCGKFLHRDGSVLPW